MSNYIKLYSDFINKNLKISRPLKVIFDCSNGTTGLIIKNLKNKNLKIKIINGKPNGNFPAHGPNPLENAATNQLSEEIKKEKADLGIIFDADGDRAFFLDNSGKLIDPDIITKLLIWQIKPKKIIIDPRVSWLIKNPKNLPSDVKIIESRVGHYFIKNLMRKTKAELGAERSGHYYFPASDNLYFDSGILTSIQTINAISNLPYSLSNFIALLPQYYHSDEINIAVTNQQKSEMILKSIENNFKNQANKISHLDGLTMEFKDWWFNLRTSNTEPFIRLNIETTNKEHLDESIKKLYFLISNFK